MLNYTTGYKFGGNARKHFKGSQRHNRSVSKWLAGHKGCFVCRKDHRARDHHTRPEVSDAINALKKKYPHALVTIDDFALVVGDMAAGYTSNDHDSEELSSSDDSDTEGNVNLAECVSDTDKDTEIFLANTSFIHGRSFKKDLVMSMRAMQADLSQGETRFFNGLYIDTGANRSSVMCYDQYRPTARSYSSHGDYETRD